MDGWTRRQALLLFGTGARVGEIASLRWDAVDLEHGVMVVVGKTGRREIPLVDDLVRELERTPPAERVGLVLGVARSTAMTTVYAALELACARAGVSVVRPHGLRRHFVDSLYGGGVDVGIAASILGQSPQVALKHYRSARPDEKRRAVVQAGLGKVPEGRVVALPGTGRRNNDEE
jgi:integrase/recombinase XerC